MATKYSVEFVDPESNSVFRVVFVVVPGNSRPGVWVAVEREDGRDALGAPKWVRLSSDAGCYPRVLATATFLVSNRINVQEIDDPATV